MQAALPWLKAGGITLNKIMGFELIEFSEPRRGPKMNYAGWTVVSRSNSKARKICFRVSKDVAEKSGMNSGDYIRFYVNAEKKLIMFMKAERADRNSRKIRSDLRSMNHASMTIETAHKGRIAEILPGQCGEFEIINTDEAGQLVLKYK